ncbi:fluoride efflux transporter CrcB [Bacillus canaveralius]|uniref:Fluoride-specific ion channel FluC n=2 Tax=Bacillus canaveralius TaxID=1403243 RepID=A0A2N5GGN1_9BACI|nr:fluoride efflux transporter CrcB [Bacillus canaveralius]PLR79918.1 fluoride efflux transporter CrcB [Bacillus canaveralius]PLR96048.1 fluoride efflux transporter CrcB [Bacillus canaveralius]RSK51645.1 fluoride efflux transporter CrcB [Bacillus canaveralius]
MNVLYVMIGGFFGAICRYALGEWLAADRFPIGTLTINLLGCLFLGWFLTSVSERKTVRPETVLFIGTGFTGSFTTFSAFSLETINLLKNGYELLAILYILASIILGILLVFIGYKLANVKGGAG